LDEGFVKGWTWLKLESTLWRAGLPCVGLCSSPSKATALIQAERVARFWGRFAAQRGQDRLPQVIFIGLENVLHRHEKGDPKVAFCHCAYCLLNPGGTPCTSVSSHGPFGLIERLQPLLQR
jgi:hypothetical protein